jgi:protein TonB
MYNGWNMFLNQAQNALDLLGQAGPLGPGGNRLPGPLEPQLQVAWGSFRQSLGSSVRAILSRSRLSNEPLLQDFFKDCRIERSIPVRAVLAAALWHVVFVVFPTPAVRMLPRHNPALDNLQLTWSGPIDDLPLIHIPKGAPVPTPMAKTPAPTPARDLEAFHPRQRIFTDPVAPTHPRQTLLNRTAPPQAPKLVANLPNIVQFQQISAPAKPKAEFRNVALEKVRKRNTASVASAPVPDVFNSESKLADVNVAMSASTPPKPKLELNAGATPRVAERTQTGDAGPAPEVKSHHADSVTPLIALSATPAPPAPIEPPKGNLASRVSMSPEGKPGKTGGEHPNDGAGGGNSPVGIKVSANEPPAPKAISDAGGEKIISPAIHRLDTTIDPNAPDEAERTGPPDFAALPPGTKPEQIFGSKAVYSMNINMPNFNSATGSWALNFSEFGGHSGKSGAPSPDLSGPAPIKKVDPKYPQTLVIDRVEGEVILYAVIHKDGTVGSIQLVHSVDEQLDANAMNALAEWKFRPATKNGLPIELEAIVHIPFRIPQTQ